MTSDKFSFRMFSHLGVFLAISMAENGHKIKWARGGR